MLTETCLSKLVVFCACLVSVLVSLFGCLDLVFPFYLARLLYGRAHYAELYKPQSWHGTYVQREVQLFLDNSRGRLCAPGLREPAVFQAVSRLSILCEVVFYRCVPGCYPRTFRVRCVGTIEFLVGGLLCVVFATPP